MIKRQSFRFNKPDNITDSDSKWPDIKDFILVILFGHYNNPLK